MNVGIVGGSGFIGFALAKHLSKKYTVKILDIKAPDKPIPKSIEYLYADILDDFAKTCAKFEGLDIVIHTAIIQLPIINKERRLGYYVNVKGLQNVCEAVYSSDTIKAIILTSSWHVFGESGIKGIINEGSAYRPNNVSERAQFYAKCKIMQELIMQSFHEISPKNYGIIRIGTVLGECMPEKTCASIFINNGLIGKLITPYRSSMHRPMLYVDIKDICKAFELYIKKIIDGNMPKNSNIINVFYPEPITILELAQIVQEAIKTESFGRINPKISIVADKNKMFFRKGDKKHVKVDLTKLRNTLGMKQLSSPKESIQKIIKKRMRA